MLQWTSSKIPMTPARKNTTSNAMPMAIKGALISATGFIFFSGCNAVRQPLEA
jgi:hypothetical protein